MANSQENKFVLTADQNDPDVVAQQLKHASRFDGVVIGLGAIAFIAMMSFILQGIWPFVLCFALFLLLFPFREYRSARVIMVAAGVMFGFWLCVTLLGILFPFIFGLLIAYLFNPVVTWIEANWKINRGWSSLVIVLILTGLVVLLGFILIPKLIDQLQALLTMISNYFQGTTLTLDEEGIRNFFLKIGLPKQFVDLYVSGEIIPRIKDLSKEFPKIIVAIISAIPDYAARVLDLLLIPVAAIYFLKDWNKMIESIQSLVPQRHRPAFISTFRGIDKVLYGYIRGQSTVAVIIGTLGAITFTIMGVPYAVLIGISITLLDLIPFLGLFISVAIIEGIIVLTMPVTFGNILSGLIVIAALHAFENYYLGPRIVGKGINIPPVLLIMSLFVFGYFMGFFGMLISVPLTGIIMLFVREYRQAISEHPNM